MRVVTLMILAAGPMLVMAQQPSDKSPPLPPVNPAIAKLDANITDLAGPGFAVAFSSVNNYLVASCEQGIIQGFKKESLEAFKAGKGKADAILSGHQGPVVALAWNGGPILASAAVDRKIIFWKMPEAKSQHTSPSPFAVRALAMSNDGKLLASAGESGDIQLWDVASGKPGAKLSDHKDWVHCLSFSSDGKQLASGSVDGSIRVWDVAAAKKTAQLPAPPNPAPKTPVDPVAATSIGFAPDGKTIVVGTADGPIQFYTIADGKTARTLPGHTAPVTGIAFHPAGNVMASCSKDRTVKLWLPNNNQMVKSLDGHTAWVEGLTFLDQGTRIASVSADQTVKIWDLAEPAKKK